MERRKSRGSNLNELAIVKAAAWAWYQQGSGSEGRPMREYDLARTQSHPKPSRYKLEAMKEEEHVQEDPKLTSPLLSPLSSAGESSLSLLDTYEIQRISRQLDHYIESSRVEHFRSFSRGDSGNRSNRKVVSLSESGTSEKRRKPKDKSSNLKGFWLVACGSRHDVVQALQRSRRVN